jgi:hypothetical protein
MKCYSALCAACSYVWQRVLGTHKEAGQLEVVHSGCLWQTLGVRRCDHHRFTDIRARCGTISLAEMLKAGRLRRLGHVL